MFIPGYGNVGTPAQAAITRDLNPTRAGTAARRAEEAALPTLIQPPSQTRDSVQDLSRDRGTESTSTGGVSQTFSYPTVLPPLSAQQQEALMARRRAATRTVEETQAATQRERARAEADAVRQRANIARNQQLQSRAGMQTLAGRGVARSPMLTNPFQRQLAEQSQRQVGELESGLAGTLSQLDAALRQAEIGRERELAQIDFDTATARSDLARLLGA